MFQFEKYTRVHNLNHNIFLRTFPDIFCIMSAFYFVSWLVHIYEVFKHSDVPNG